MRPLLPGRLATLLLVLLLPLSALAAGEVFDRAKLKQYSEASPDQLLADPQVACALKQLLTGAEVGALTERMQMIELGATDADGLGAFVFPGAVPGLYTVMEGFVMVEPGGRLWVAYIDDEEVKYFTNDAASLSKPPKTLEQWRGRFEEKALVAVTAKRGLPAKSVAETCGGARATVAGAAGCTGAETPFDSTQAATVKPGAAGRKVYFFSEPVACPGTGACPSRKKAYLVENDAVTLSRAGLAREGFLCVHYQSLKGKVTVGWMPEAELTRDLLAVKPGPKAPGRKPADWVAQWERGEGLLVVAMEGAQGLSVTGEASDDEGRKTGEFRASYKVSGPLATPVKRGAGVCEVTLRLFNNALYARDNGQCGAGGRFTGLYTRAFEG
jgi:hypothetical protein